MNAFTKRNAIVASLLALGAGSAAAVPFEVEGIATQITKKAEIVSGVPTIGKLVCNGADIYLTNTTVITTPTTTIGIDQLVDPTPFPQRATAFLNGTCIADGDTNAQGNAIAANLYVEPAENVLVGPVTRPNNAGPLKIMGVRVIRLTNATTNSRIHAPLPTNAYGFEIDINSIPDGDEASAEGYVVPAAGSTPATLYAYAIETTGGTILPDRAASMVAIQRADARVDGAQGKMEVRGGCMFDPLSPAVNTRNVTIEVQAYNTANPPRLVWFPVPDEDTGNAATCTRDPGTNFGVYRLRNDAFTLPGGVAPTRVRASIAGVRDADGKQLYKTADMTSR